jgi:predicted RecB family nuclease
MQLSARFMNKRIRTYEDLLQEEQRLLEKVKATEALIKEDISGLKHGLKPLNNVVDTIKKFTTRDPVNPLINFGLNLSVDLLIRRLLLNKAGWLTKVVVPFIVKNYSSHLLHQQQRVKLMKKVQDIFNRIRPKTDKAEPVAS